MSYISEIRTGGETYRTTAAVTSHVGADNSTFNNN